MGLTKWYKSQAIEIKVAIIGGFFAVMAAAVGGAVGAVHLGDDNGASRQPSSGTGSASATPRDPSKRLGRLMFVNISNDEKVGRRVKPLLIAGTVPPGEHAWVFVKSSDAYYIQGPLSRSSDLWTLSAVNLGSSTGPINSPYIISIILADTDVNSKIRDDYVKTNRGNTGIPAIPSGAKKVWSITVVRTH